MDHVTKPIARTSSCRIDRCSCGAIHVSVAGTTVRIREGVARELRDVLAAAFRELDRQSTTTAAAPSFFLVPSIVGDDDGDPELH